jgi:hypothetical protein
LRVKREVRAAFLIVWVILSAGLLLAQVAPMLLAGGTLERLAPACESRTRYSRACLACGLTTSFRAICKGDWEAARAAHRGGLPLYAFLLVNHAGVLLFLALKGVR